MPVIRQPFSAESDGSHPFIAGRSVSDTHLLFDVADAAESENMTGSRREAQYVELLRHALNEVDAPEDQLQRLGLS